MNLGQMMLVIAALTLLGILVLNTNSTVLETNDTQNMSEFGITAVSLATSLVEEAMGKMYDEVIADSTTGALSATTQLSATLGKEGAEAYRSPTTDFDDFDDFHNIWLVYKNPLDSTVTAGATREVVVPGIRDRYNVRAFVRYVDPTTLNNNNMDSVSAVRTWHKKITVVVTGTSPSFRDTLVYPAIMSYWN